MFITTLEVTSTIYIQKGPFHLFYIPEGNGVVWASRSLFLYTGFSYVVPTLI